MNCSMPGLPVHHQLPQSTQTHVHWDGDAIQSSNPLLSPSPPALNLSQHQGLFNESALCIRWPKYWSYSFTDLDSILKKQRHYFVNKDPCSQGYGFSSGHVWMWELDCKESWAQKNWCFWTVVLDKTLESPLDCKEIQPVHPKGDQSRVFIGLP